MKRKKGLSKGGALLLVGIAAVIGIFWAASAKAAEPGGESEDGDGGSGGAGGGPVGPAPLPTVDPTWLPQEGIPATEHYEMYNQPVDYPYEQGLLAQQMQQAQTAQQAQDIATQQTELLNQQMAQAMASQPPPTPNDAGVWYMDKPAAFAPTASEYAVDQAQLAQQMASVSTAEQAQGIAAQQTDLANQQLLAALQGRVSGVGKRRAKRRRV